MVEQPTTINALCIMGPTASGKTAIAIELVQRFPFEIISIDSAMIYRGFDIGTAKPTSEELAKAPHYLIDIIDPPDVYSAAQCCEDVEKLCNEITKRGKIPLLVGGTMMYFNALQKGLSTLPSADDTIRNNLIEQAVQYGWEYMHALLAKVDPVSAERIHPNDTQRIQRALEVYEITKTPLSELWNLKPDASKITFFNLAIMPQNRVWLHERIARRFKQMLDEGFIEEVENLVKNWSLTLSHPSMRSVGYRQVFDYLLNHYDLTTLEEKGIAATRQLAKRQLTWLRHWDHKLEFIAENPLITDEIVASVQKILDNIGIDI